MSNLLICSPTRYHCATADTDKGQQIYQLTDYKIRQCGKHHWKIKYSILDIIHVKQIRRNSTYKIQYHCINRIGATLWQTYWCKSYTHDIWWKKFDENSWYIKVFRSDVLVKQFQNSWQCLFWNMSEYNFISGISLWITNMDIALRLSKDCGVAQEVVANRYYVLRVYF